MMFKVLMVMASIFNATWFIWPIAFVFGLAHGIKTLLQTEKVFNPGLVVAAIALLLIVAWFFYVSLA